MNFNRLLTIFILHYYSIFCNIFYFLVYFLFYFFNAKKNAPSISRERKSICYLIISNLLVIVD